MLAVDDNDVSRREQLHSRRIRFDMSSSGMEALELLRAACQNGDPYKVAKWTFNLDNGEIRGIKASVWMRLAEASLMAAEFNFGPATAVVTNRGSASNRLSADIRGLSRLAYWPAARIKRQPSRTNRAWKRRDGGTG